MAEDSIPLNELETVEARVLIERKRSLDAERRALSERLSNLSNALLSLDREQDAWLAGLAIRKGVSLPDLRNSTIDVRRSRVFLKKEGG